ncbi:extensin-like domain-containing protein [Litoreibacter roseus]|uniref:Extensin-like C-terminal domain-containing protein n=1 Tax=Litoreibacter roseus TaxID=2601869 RepID=A0A6N6JEX9_9RHOB|nr:extensin family protein [Litoreibacter roseus]GFE64786.1 hypothetical protein KIN_18600 [Litoreibacter roseus]
MRWLTAIWRAGIALCIAALVGYGVYDLHAREDSPIPREWNALKRLYISDPVTPLTGYKLSAATRDPQICQAVLQDGGVQFRPMPDLEASPQCHIRGRVSLTGVGAAWIAPVETRCAIALRMAMWEQHALQSAATTHLGTDLTRIEHFSSYNCRAIRTGAGISNRMSTHATADAIDISGFQFADGRRITLKDNWSGPADAANFLKDARDSACRWFETTLGPDYNALHADHFHLQSRGWGTCR